MVKGCIGDIDNKVSSQVQLVLNSNSKTSNTGYIEFA